MEHTTCRTIVALIALTAASGCATLTSSDVQPLALTTHTEQGQAVEKVKCTARNDKGFWEATSPAILQVRRSPEDLLVECKVEGQPDGHLKAVSRVAGGMFGNIIFGGGIGAIIDHSRGTGYNYPDRLPVKMGQWVVVGRRDQDVPPGTQASVQQPAATGSAPPPGTAAAEARAAEKVLSEGELARLFGNTLD